MLKRRNGPRRLPPRFYVSTSKSIIKALINMHSFEIQLS
ncbi:flavodoxin family protein, partial [Salmonella enterica subsp. enterica serovar Typhimurium]